MVDELTVKIKTNLRLTEEQIASDFDKEVGEITTSSTEAFRYYSEARMYHRRSRPNPAIESYEKAIELDPEFAMAYRGMAAAYSNRRGGSSKTRVYAQKAFDLRHRVSIRERNLIEIYYFYQNDQTRDKAIETCLNLLEFYPDEPLGYSYLGLIYAGKEEWEKSRENHEAAFRIQNDPLHLSNLIYVCEALGLYDKAINLCEDYLKDDSKEAKIHLMLARIYLIQGEYELSLAELETLLSLDPDYNTNYRWRGHIYLLNDDFVQAEKEYNKIKNGDSGFNLTNLNISRGILKKPRDRANQVFSNLNFDINADQTFFKGLNYLGNKSIAEAERIADELMESKANGMKRRRLRYHNYLQGLIQIEKDKFREAIPYLEEVESSLSFQNRVRRFHAFFMEPLAFAYYKSGNLNKAIQQYGKIISLTIGRLNYGDIYAKSYYMLGKIYEEQGNTAKAIEHYEKFLDLWKDADPGIAEVSDARERGTVLRK
jgi:tetratricopeptide (TPR) repeat protein